MERYVSELGAKKNRLGAAGVQVTAAAVDDRPQTVAVATNDHHTLID